MVAVETTTKWSFKGANLPIDTVTVYRPSGAQVVRKLDLDLKVSAVGRSAFAIVQPSEQAGNNVIEVTGLSSVTDTESLRVSGLGNVRLLVANCLREQFTEISESDPIRALKSQEHELRAERDARKAEVEILRGFGAKMGDMPDLTPDQANSFVDTLFEKTLACAETVKALDDKIEEVKRRIDKVESEKAGSAFVKAVITVVANDDGPVQLKLTYRRSQFTANQLFIC